MGAQYELIIVERARPAESIIWRHKGSRTYQVKYTVAAGADHTAPAWLARPSEKDKHYEEYGCGPALGVAFAAAVRDESACLVRATVRDLASQQTITCYLRPGAQVLGPPPPGAAADDLVVGHGMCNGGFVLENGRDFAVTFELLDEAGNRTPWAAAPLRFTRPAIPGQ